MSQYATTYAPDGRSIFSPRVPQNRHIVDTDLMGIEFLFISENSIPNFSTEDDLDSFQDAHNTVLSPYGAIPTRGFGTAIMTFKTKDLQPLHRVMSMDTLYILEGSIEIRLDSGEKRTLHKGDSLIQRATMHAGRNVSEDGGDCKLLIHSVPCERPIRIGDKELIEEWDEDSI